MTLSTIIFVFSLVSIGGVLLWKQYLVSAQEQYKKDLVVREQQFNIDLIRQMKAESTKISLAKNLLNNHVAVSKLFSVISSLTAENVRFLNMDFASPSDQSGNEFKITMSGYSRDLPTVAFQAQVLNKLGDFGIKNVVRNPIVSDPTFNIGGSVSFNLAASLDPSVLLYQVGTTDAAPAAPSSSNPPR